MKVPLKFEEHGPEPPKTPQASTNSIENPSQAAVKGPVELTEPPPVECQENVKSTLEPKQPNDKTVREQGTSTNIEASEPIKIEPLEASASKSSFLSTSLTFRILILHIFSSQT